MQVEVSVTDDDVRLLIDDSKRRAERSVVALTDAFIRRIDDYQPVLNAFITTTPEAARTAARGIDELRARDERLLLDGMAVAVKDNIDVAGVRGTIGSKFFATRIAETDAEVVRRLRAAGAVFLGKTLLHEFAFGGTSNNPFYGPCRNPWDLTRVPGGSSGGSGAAVAADLTIGALGSDTGGSVRTPAHMNGVSALRPTFGRVSTTGVFPTAWSFDTVGPMARSVSDIARLFAVMAGFDRKDIRAADQPVVDPLIALDDGVAGLRIGLPEKFFFEDLDPELATHVRAAADIFGELGSDLVEIELTGAAEAAAAGMRMAVTEAYAVHRTRYEEQPDLFGEDTRRRLAEGKLTTGADYAALVQQTYEWQRTLQATFDQVDLVLTPTASGVAPKIDEAETVTTTAHLGRFTYALSVAHIPVLSLPCGITREGLPVGFQIAARAWQEARLLTAGAAYQAATDWHRRRPPERAAGSAAPNPT